MTTYRAMRCDAISLCANVLETGDPVIFTVEGELEIGQDAMNVARLSALRASSRSARSYQARDLERTRHSGGRTVALRGAAAAIQKVAVSLHCIRPYSPGMSPTRWLTSTPPLRLTATFDDDPTLDLDLDHRGRLATPY